MSALDSMRRNVLSLFGHLGCGPVPLRDLPALFALLGAVEGLQRSIDRVVDGTVPMRKRAAFAAILADVCERHGVSLQELRGKGRARPLSLARQELEYRMRADLGMSSSAVADFLRRDRSSVIFGSESHARRHGLPLAWPRGRGGRLEAES